MHPGTRRCLCPRRLVGAMSDWASNLGAANLLFLLEKKTSLHISQKVCNESITCFIRTAPKRESAD